MSKIIFGIDLGNKQTKLMSEKASYRLPSHYTVKDNLSAGFSMGYSNDLDIHTFELDDNEYTWGADVDKSLTSEKIKDTIGIGSKRYTNNNFKNLANFAIALLGNDFLSEDDDTLKVSVVTGLPTEDFENDDCVKGIKDALKKHVIASIDGKPVDIQVEDVFVLPQPLGSVFDVVKTEKNKDVASELINVIDLGGGTVLVDTLQNLNYDIDSTIQLDTGSFTLFRKIRRQLIIQKGVRLSIFEIEDIIRKGTKNGKYIYQQHKGNEVDITDIVKDNINIYTQDVIDEITTNLMNADYVDETFITGGGSKIVNREMMEKAFNNVKFTKHNEMSNVFGFFEYGLSNNK